MVTIKDIAKKMKLSPSTVSRALNNNPRIGEKTRRQVHKYAKKMGYQPNYNAKNLTNQEANSVGIIFPVNNRVVDNIFYVGILRGINEELNRRNYVLAIAIGDSTQQVIDNVESMIHRAQIKKFIFLYSHQNDKIIDLVRKEAVKFVTIGKPVDDQKWWYVDNDNVAAGEDATRFLIEKKKSKNPAFVESVNNWPYEDDRRAGYIKELSKTRKQPNFLQISQEHGLETESAQIKKFIDEHPQVDSVVATDDYIALQFDHSYKDLYPGKAMYIIGFNNSLPSELNQPNFFSVDLNAHAMGTQAVDLLFKNQQETENISSSHLIVEHKIKGFKN